jgi:hypothetical protein
MEKAHGQDGTDRGYALRVTVMLLRRALAEGYVKFPMFAYFGVLVCVALVASIPVLFAVGEKVTGRAAA